MILDNKLKTKEIECYLNKTFDILDLSVNIDVQENKKGFEVKINSNNSINLIGKHGKNVHSLNRILNTKFKTHKNKCYINIDINDYKQKKITKLKEEIQNICTEVENTKIEAIINEPNAYKRKLIYEVVNKNKKVKIINNSVDGNRSTIIRYHN